MNAATAQPDSAHYRRGYLSHERWLSYVHQITAVSDLAPKSVIEVGVGPGVKKAMTEAAFEGCRYVGVDLRPALGPQVCADVLRLPFADGAADVTFCCQVLEHLPYEHFVASLDELKRVTRQRVVMSLPDVRPFFYLRARVPGFRHAFPWLWKGISLSHPFAPRHCFESHGQHHWEIGKRGFSARRVLDDIGSLGWGRVRQFRMIERWYWHFFLLDL